MRYLRAIPLRDKQDMEVKIVENPRELELCYPVVSQLRPHLSLEQYKEAVSRMKREGFILAYISDGGVAVCVAGYRFMELLATGKVLYIDDIVTCEKHRSKRYGAEMLKWLKATAESSGCRYIELDSGANRKEAHRFYEREGFEAVALHLSLPVGGEKKWVENS